MTLTMVKPHSPISQCKTINCPSSAESLYPFDHGDQVAASMTNPQHNQKEDELRSYPEPALSDSSVQVYSLSSPAMDTCKDGRNVRVRFDNRIRVREVQHRNNMSPDIVQSTWWTKDDYLTTKEELRMTIRLMMANDVVDEDDDGLCARGLEGRTSDGSSYRTRKKSLVKGAVLLEQHQQRLAGIVDEEKIALLCSSWSSQCALEARNMAMRDAQDAKWHWNSSASEVTKHDTNCARIDDDDDDDDDDSSISTNLECC